MEATLLPEIALPAHGEFPEVLYIIQTSQGTHIVINTTVLLDPDGDTTTIHGLAAYVSVEEAIKRVKTLTMSGLKIIAVKFEQAREIALNQPAEVVAIILEENLKQKAVHYVR